MVETVRHFFDDLSSDLTPPLSRPLYGMDVYLEYQEHVTGALGVMGRWDTIGLFSVMLVQCGKSRFIELSLRVFRFHS